jgi:murein DD-endopeptidase MepM/ murein hydrolase activator NlpD
MKPLIKTLIFALVIFNFSFAIAQIQIGSNKQKTSSTITKMLNVNQQEADTNKLLDTRENCDFDTPICIKEHIFEESAIIEAENRGYGTFTLQIDMWSSNARIKYLVDKDAAIVKAGEKVRVAEIFAVDKNFAFSHSVKFNSFYGHAQAIHNDDYIYDLPFNPGESYKLVQGFGGGFSHNTPETYYSYDFRMNNGTHVLAARSGVVSKVVENKPVGSMDKRMIDQDNHIYIEHEDGTVAIYAHLARGGAVVKEGDKVQKGQHIGHSGNSGYSRTPHLHFSVAKYLKQGRLKSLPIKIRTSQGISSRLEVHQFYKK